MRALVLGGNRYIGMHLVFELARRGHEVTIINSHEGPMPNGARRIHADRQQPGALGAALEKVRGGIDIVYDNTAYVPNDLQTVIDVMRGRIQQLVFTSSVATYKPSWIAPVRESFARHEPDNPDARNTYGVGKVQCEDLLLSIDDIATTSLRVTHTIGPMSPLSSREPSFFKRLEEGRPILVPGEGFPFVHLVHVQDVATLMASVAGNERTSGQTYNVAGAEVASILGCIRLMAGVVGVEPNIVHVPMDIARQARPPLVHWAEAIAGGATFSIEKALAELEWSPSFGLEAAYRDSYEWFTREGRNRYEFDFSGDDSVLAQLV